MGYESQKQESQAFWNSPEMGIENARFLFSVELERFEQGSCRSIKDRETPLTFG